MSSRILLLGPPNVGKTHYGAVLIEKWQVNLGELKLTTPVQDLKVFEEARKCLQEGRGAPHTSRDLHRDTLFNLQSPTGEEVELIWPDYAGEQLTQVVTQRRIPDDWVNKVSDAQSWVLMIRPNLIEPLPDILNSINSRITPSTEPTTPLDRRWDSNAWWVELLQMLLASEGVSHICRLSKPRIAVVLSCWDELLEMEQRLRPDEVLEKRLPLLASFLKSNWEIGSRSVWGLSALGQSLTNIASEDYIDQGPAAFGFIMNPDGVKSSAIDLPLEWFLRKSHD